MPVMSSVRCRVAAMTLSMGVMVGTGLAWWLKQNLLVSCSPPVSAMIVQMQQYCLSEGPMYQPLAA